MIMINTKRIFTALLLAIIAVTSYAYDFEVDGIYYCYDVYGNAVVTHGNKKYTGKIKIPSEVKWNGKKKKVVEIGDYAFECCYELKSVSIPSFVYYIGRFAFSNCRLLEEINIPNGVEAIKVSAFVCCDKLENISLPVSVKQIEMHAFAGSGLKTIKLFGEVTSIGEYAFNACRNLESVKIPNTVTSIKHRAFQNCRNLESIIIPSSVNSIGISAFSGCKALKDIYCQAVNVPETHSSAFDNSPIENMTLYVPGESMNAYKTTAPWSGFGKFQTLTTGIEKTETAAKPMITTADGQIAVSGLSGNASIQVLSLDGKLLDSTNATDGIATLNAQPGEVVIVKVGTESYKVVVR